MPNNYGQKRKKVCYVEAEAPKACMTVILMADMATAQEVSYPKLHLYSSDKAYNQTLTPANDLVPKDEYLQLRFKELLPEKRYTLEMEYSADEKEVLLTDQPYQEVIDQNMPEVRRAVDEFKDVRRLPS